MEGQAVLRRQLLDQLRGGQAHVGFEDVIANFPLPLINTRPPNVPYTFWHLIEHMRITQEDILEFVRDPNHISPDWPTGYWPDPAQEASVTEWNGTLAAFRHDLRAVEALASEPATDLFGAIPHGTGQTILREILLVADHNAYHIGELGILRQVMQAWPDDHSSN